MTPGATSEIEAVLFDMGGVVVQLDALENVIGSSARGPEEIWTAWILSDAVKAFERGRCDVDAFAAALLAEFQLEGTAGDFIARFTAFPQGLYPGAVELVRSVPETVTTGVLSNTNALHWEHQQDAEVLQTLFDRAYLSYELDMVKPERHIFDYAVADLGLVAGQVLFIDDNQINVDGARSAGLQAELAKGPDDAARVLQAFGLIS